MEPGSRSGAFIDQPHPEAGGAVHSLGLGLDRVLLALDRKRVWQMRLWTPCLALAMVLAVGSFSQARDGNPGPGRVIPLDAAESLERTAARLHQLDAAMAATRERLQSTTPFAPVDDHMDPWRAYRDGVAALADIAARPAENILRREIEERTAALVASNGRTAQELRQEISELHVNLVSTFLALTPYERLQYAVQEAYAADAASDAPIPSMAADAYMVFFGMVGTAANQSDATSARAIVRSLPVCMLDAGPVAPLRRGLERAAASTLLARAERDYHISRANRLASLTRPAAVWLGCERDVEQLHALQVRLEEVVRSGAISESISDPSAVLVATRALSLQMDGVWEEMAEVAERVDQAAWRTVHRLNPKASLLAPASQNTLAWETLGSLGEDAHALYVRTAAGAELVAHVDSRSEVSVVIPSYSESRATAAAGPNLPPPARILVEGDRLRVVREVSGHVVISVPSGTDLLQSSLIRPADGVRGTTWDRHVLDQTFLSATVSLLDGGAIQLDGRIPQLIHVQSNDATALLEFMGLPQWASARRAVLEFDVDQEASARWSLRAEIVVPSLTPEGWEEKIPSIPIELPSSVFQSPTEIGDRVLLAAGEAAASAAHFVEAEWRQTSGRREPAPFMWSLPGAISPTRISILSHSRLQIRADVVTTINTVPLMLRVFASPRGGSLAIDRVEVAPEVAAPTVALLLSSAAMDRPDAVSDRDPLALLQRVAGEERRFAELQAEAAAQVRRDLESLVESTQTRLRAMGVVIDESELRWKLDSLADGIVRQVTTPAAQNPGVPIGDLTNTALSIGLSEVIWLELGRGTATSVLSEVERYLSDAPPALDAAHHVRDVWLSIVRGQSTSVAKTLNVELEKTWKNTGLPNSECGEAVLRPLVEELLASSQPSARAEDVARQIAPEMRRQLVDRWTASLARDIGIDSGGAVSSDQCRDLVAKTAKLQDAGALQILESSNFVSSLSAALQVAQNEFSKQAGAVGVDLLSDFKPLGPESARAISKAFLNLAATKGVSASDAAHTAVRRLRHEILTDLVSAERSDLLNLRILCAEVNASTELDVLELLRQATPGPIQNRAKEIGFAPRDIQSLIDRARLVRAVLPAARSSEKLQWALKMAAEQLRKVDALVSPAPAIGRIASSAALTLQLTDQGLTASITGQLPSTVRFADPSPWRFDLGLALGKDRTTLPSEVVKQIDQLMESAAHLEALDAAVDKVMADVNTAVLESARALEVEVRASLPEDILSSPSVATQIVQIATQTTVPRPFVEMSEASAGLAFEIAGQHTLLADWGDLGTSLPPALTDATEVKKVVGALQSRLEQNKEQLQAAAKQQAAALAQALTAKLAKNGNQGQVALQVAHEALQRAINIDVDVFGLILKARLHAESDGSALWRLTLVDPETAQEVAVSDFVMIVTGNASPTLKIRPDCNLQLAEIKPMLDRALDRMLPGLKLSAAPRVAGGVLTIPLEFTPGGLPVPVSATLTIEDLTKVRLSTQCQRLVTNLLQEGLQKSLDALRADGGEMPGLGFVKVTSTEFLEVPHGVGVKVNAELRVVEPLFVPVTVIFKSNTSPSISIDEDALVTAMGPILGSLQMDALPLSLRLATPAYSVDGELRVFLRFTVDVPILAGGAGGRLVVSSRGVKLDGAVEFRFPGWIDTPPVSFGNIGAALDLRRKSIEMRCDVAIAPGEINHRLLRAALRGTLAVEPLEFSATGDVLLVQVLRLAQSKVQLAPTSGSFLIDSQIGGVLSKIVAIHGTLQIEAKEYISIPRLEGFDANLYAMAEFHLLDMSLASLDIGMNWELALRAKAEVHIPLGDASADVSCGPRLHDPVIALSATLADFEPLSQIHVEATVSDKVVFANARASALGISLETSLDFPGVSDLTVPVVIRRLLDCLDLRFRAPQQLGINLNNAPEPKNPDSVRKPVNSATLPPARPSPPPLPDITGPWERGWEQLEEQKTVQRKKGGWWIFGGETVTETVTVVTFNPVPALEFLGLSGEQLASDLTFFRKDREFLTVLLRNGRITVFDGTREVWDAHSAPYDQQPTLNFVPQLVLGELCVAFYGAPGAPPDASLLFACSRGKTLTILPTDMPKLNGVLATDSRYPRNLASVRVQDFTAVQAIAREDNLRPLVGVAASLRLRDILVKAIRPVGPDGVYRIETSTDVLIYVPTTRGKTLLLVDTTPDGSNPAPMADLEALATSLRQLGPDTSEADPFPRIFGAYLRVTTNPPRALVLAGEEAGARRACSLLAPSISPNITGEWQVTTNQSLAAHQVLEQLTHADNDSIFAELQKFLAEALSDQRVYLSAALNNTGSIQRIGALATVSRGGTKAETVALVTHQGNDVGTWTQDFASLVAFWNERKYMLPESTPDMQLLLADPLAWMRLLVEDSWRQNGWKANPLGGFIFEKSAP